MLKKCPKCGYERQQDDKPPFYQCPSCGTSYAEYEEDLNHHGTRTNARPMKEPDITTPQSEVQMPVRRFVSPIVVISVVLALTMCFVAYKFYSNMEKRKANRKFSALVETVRWKMAKLATASEDVVDEINAAWREAIFSENGKRDFNDAIMEVRKKRANAISSIGSLSEEIGEEIRKVTPPPGKEKDYQRLKDLYLLFNKYANMAVTPSGSLETYSRQNSELTVEIRSAMKELDIMR